MADQIELYDSRHTGPVIDDAVDRLIKTPGTGALTAADVNAAPAGYGFGNTLESIPFDSQDESYESYCAKVDAILKQMPLNTAKLVMANPPELYGEGDTLCALFKSANVNYASIQTISGYSLKTTGFSMVKSAGVWQPLDWINPPMKLGVEYRTTERYLGKPVYVQVVDCGKCPESALKSVAHGINNILHMLSCVAEAYNSVGYTSTIPQDHVISGASVVRSASANATNINVYSNNSDLATYIIYAKIKYTKTTD